MSKREKITRDNFELVERAITEAMVGILKIESEFGYILDDDLLKQWFKRIIDKKKDEILKMVQGKK